MIRKIPTSELRIGMFIDNLDCGWMEHPFMKNRFMVGEAQIVQKIASAGIRHVYIDTEQGRDIEEAPTREEVEASLDQVMDHIARNEQPDPVRTGVAEETVRARALYREATAVIRNMMEDARLGQQVKINAIEPVAERMIQTAIRNHHAINSVTRIKSKDEYTFMHCVSVAGLMITFARALELPEETVHQVAIGGLVHDIGKTMVPHEILNKPGRLEGEKMEIMKKHVIYSGEILQDVTGISQIALDITMLHHERMDGTGYPLGLSGNEISLIGQMSAIVDVYDALTSVRVYKDAWEPTQTLKKLLEWSPDHFNEQLVHHFIRCLGIYPVGSLVELESGRVGIVTEPGEDLLHPKLRILYDAKKCCYVRIQEIDMRKENNDRIVSAISPRRHNINLDTFL